MKFLEKVESKVDNVVKYVFQLWPNESNPEIIVEFSYIDNGTGKDIICVSCQTMCNMGCKFCHCTDYISKIHVRSLTEHDILSGVAYIVRDLDVKKDTLLVSYMGCGEPFYTLLEDSVLRSMLMIRNACKDIYKTVRFGLATSLPKKSVQRFFRFAQQVKDNNLPVKLHLSLHYTNGTTRAEWMPNSLDIQSSIAACNFYKQYTKNAVEIHYTLIDGVNDSQLDAQMLNYLLEGCDFNVKVITYNEKDTLDYKTSTNTSFFLSLIELPTEVYTPPGRDVGASCGQFLLETHMREYEYEKTKQVLL